MKSPRLVIILAAVVWSTGHLSAQPAAAPVIVEAKSGQFGGWVDKHSCWHNVMLTDEPHSTHSGTGVVDTPNKTGSFIQVAYDAVRAGPEQKYQIRGMSGPEHVCVIGFLDASLPHTEIAARMTRYLADPFSL